MGVTKSHRHRCVSEDVWHAALLLPWTPFYLFACPVLTPCWLCADPALTPLTNNIVWNSGHRSDTESSSNAWTPRFTITNVHSDSDVKSMEIWHNPTNNTDGQ